MKIIRRLLLILLATIWWSDGFVLLTLDDYGCCCDYRRFHENWTVHLAGWCWGVGHSFFFSIIQAHNVPNGAIRASLSQLKQTDGFQAHNMAALSSVSCLVLFASCGLKQFFFLKKNCVHVLLLVKIISWFALSSRCPVAWTQLQDVVNKSDEDFEDDLLTRGLAMVGTRTHTAIRFIPFFDTYLEQFMNIWWESFLKFPL